MCGERSINGCDLKNSEVWIPPLSCCPAVARGTSPTLTTDVVTYLNHFNDDGTYPAWHPLSPQIRGPMPTARADADQDGDIDADDLSWLLDFLLGR